MSFRIFTFFLPEPFDDDEDEGLFNTSVAYEFRFPIPLEVQMIELTPDTK